MNKKVVAIAAVIIIALLAGFTIGYAVRSNVRNKQIYEKFNLTNNTTNQIPCLCVYYKGKLYPCATKTSDSSGALTEDDLKNIELEYLNFRNDSDSSTQILHCTDGGEVVATKYTNTPRILYNPVTDKNGTITVYIDPVLQINSFYCFHLP